tara:strand:+ start:104 stop:772 length:669 start_codon:yes stop_codon:yes gene_type:complete
MNNIDILLKNELKYYFELYHIVNKIYIFFENINIYTNDKYFVIVNYLFFYIPNVTILNNKNKNKKCIDYKNKNDFLNNLGIIDEINNNINNKLYRNVKNEDIYYNNLINNIDSKYIFYFNYSNKKKIINYFDNLYIFNPLQNFYEKNQKYYDKWIDLKINNLFDYLKIIENAVELHIYDMDLLYLILEIDVSHIDKKYFYYKDIKIKEDHPNLKNWNIILIN